MESQWASWHLHELSDQYEGCAAGPCGPSVHPLVPHEMSHRVEGGWLILQHPFRSTINLKGRLHNFGACKFTSEPDRFSSNKRPRPLGHYNPRNGGIQDPE